MAGPTSHNDAAGRARQRTEGARSALPAWLALLVLLGAALVCVEVLAGSQLTRTLDLYLEHLSDAGAWMR